MTYLIPAVALLATALIAVQPTRVQQLASHVPVSSMLLSLLGTSVEAVGLSTEGTLGHILVAAGVVALLGAAWPVRHWPGGRWLLLGVALNGMAMATHGRMPITPDVLAALQADATLGTVLPGSKDIVAEGVIATWCGDRFILRLPFGNRATVWSVGDVAILGGVLGAATGKRARQRHPAARAARSKGVGTSTTVS